MFPLAVALTVPELALSGVTVDSLGCVEVIAHSESLQRSFVVARFEPLDMSTWDALAHGGHSAAAGTASADLGGVYFHQVAATRGAGDNAATLIVGTLSTGATQTVVHWIDPCCADGPS